MRLPWRKRTRYCDFDEVLEDFARSLGLLSAHIREHDLIVGAARVASEIDVAIAKIRLIRDFEGPDLPDDNAPAEVRTAWAEAYQKEEDAAWDDVWEYIRTHARKWWD